MRSRTAARADTGNDGTHENSLRSVKRIEAVLQNRPVVCPRWPAEV